MRKILFVMILTVLFGINTQSTLAFAPTNKPQEKSAVVINNDDYSGHYLSNAESGCKIEIIITKAKSGYNYTIKGKNINLSGKAEISNGEAESYIIFKAKNKSKKSQDIEALFTSDSITIQNYGNAMNNYVHFKSCDAKFIVFVKK